MLRATISPSRSPCRRQYRRNPLGLEVEACRDPIEHGLDRIDLDRDPGRRRLDVDDHPAQEIDQVIDAVGELHLVAPARGPGRRRIGRRHRLWRLSRIDRRVLALQRRQVLTDRPLGRLLVAPVDFAALDPLVAAGVGLDHAGIDGKAFAADQPDLHARRHHALEHQPKRGALTEAAVAVDRERRMVRHCRFEATPQNHL